MKDNVVLGFEDGLYIVKCNATLMEYPKANDAVGVNIHKGELWIYSSLNHTLRRGSVALRVCNVRDAFIFFEKYTP